jgi:large subunit ribosomal protein L16
MKGNATRCNRVTFGEYGLMSLDQYWLSGKHIEAGRMAAQHLLGKEGRLYIRVFPHKPVTAKPAETRMGKGKGEPEYYAAVLRPGTIIYEVGGVSEDMAKQVFNVVAHKMPVKTKFVQRRHGL